MIIFALALAATGMQLAEPKGNPVGWMTDNDYPVKAKNRRAQGPTRFRIVVTPEGKPMRCDVISSSGHDDLDQLTCILMMQRSDFSPARSEDGQPIFGTFTSKGIWQLPGAMPYPVEFTPDLSLTVSALPKSVKSPAKVRVGLLVKPDGTIAGCQTSDIPNNAETVAKLGKLACQQAVALLKPPAMLNAEKEPILSVQDFEIGFSTAR